MMIKHWGEIPERPLLAPGDCQLWMAWLDTEDPDSFRSSLSEDERARAARLRSSQSVKRFTVTRGILRKVLSRYLTCRPGSLVFSYGPHGKPELAGKPQPRLSFNVSHSGSLAIFAIANGVEIGVDIEEIHPISDLDATASIFLSPEELAEFKSLPANSKLARFFTLWTCKEAVLKAIGSGFAEPQITVQNTILQNKRLTLLTPAQGFRGALACL
ncbi:MAG: 4'-phosphopantetheinyl transferase superfamily protein [Chloroflexota bacterium]